MEATLNEFMSDTPVSFNLGTPELAQSITNHFITRRYLNGGSSHLKTLKIEYDLQNHDPQQLIDLFVNIGYKVIGCLSTDSLLYNEHNLIYTRFLRGGYSNISIHGDKTNFDEIENLILSKFNKWDGNNKSKIKWCFLNDCGKIEYLESNLEEKNPPFTEMYPFLNGESLHDYYERYNNSSASILLLQGPPGTGKTTFIRGLLQHLKKSALLSYDDAILKSDNFLNIFIKDNNINFLVFEDADAYLTSRESGNKVIHKFLNAGDGLISKSNKKIIFTTNLQSITDIDSALTRPGRCHDILQFRSLTTDESIKVASICKIEIKLPEKEYTIAEIFNTQTNTEKKVIRNIGFGNP
jgi:hypothetical protein